VRQSKNADGTMANVRVIFLMIATEPSMNSFRSLPAWPDRLERMTTNVVSLTKEGFVREFHESFDH
jgi:hypothetical protein